MALNCKVGDLAIVIRDPEEGSPLLGTVVRCLRPISAIDGFGWVTDPPPPRPYVGWFDRNLRPIRPGEGEDEMLRIAGKPRELEHIGG